MQNLYLGLHSQNTSHTSLSRHYSDVIMGTIASQITSLTIVYGGGGGLDQKSKFCNLAQ